MPSSRRYHRFATHHARDVTPTIILALTAKKWGPSYRASKWPAKAFMRGAAQENVVDILREKLSAIGRSRILGVRWRRGISSKIETGLISMACEMRLWPWRRLLGSEVAARLMRRISRHNKCHYNGDSDQPRLDNRAYLHRDGAINISLASDIFVNRSGTPVWR